MAYFANGTEGDLYEGQYCAHCRHSDQETMCPVMMLHMIHNYAECNKPDSFLHVLIPRDGIGNAECSMFLTRDGSRCRETQDMFT
jgi:hypothetical protein